MNEEKLEILEGTITAVIYRNDENGYSVLRVESDDGDTSTMVGCIPLAAPGESIIAEGIWTRHATHGEQFQARRVERELPDSAPAIYEYLAGRSIRGIGPSTAALLVSNFGDNTMEILLTKPEMVASVHGIGKKKATEICAEFRRQMGLRALMDFLTKENIPIIYALRLWHLYEDAAMEKLRENPYLLTQERVGAQFFMADELALSLGMEEDSPQRIAAAMLYELKYNERNGHCFIPREKLIDVTAQLIHVSEDAARDGLESLLDSGEVIYDPQARENACYLADLHRAETYVAQRLLSFSADVYHTEIDYELLLKKLEREQNIIFAPKQREALCAAAERKLLVITGGPGTGKTTSVRGLLALFDALKAETLLAAPTGRAAKRLSELTNREASTIHRLLEAGFSEQADGMIFRRNEDNPLECGALILDECSMVDVRLMSSVLKALPRDCRLILVGDADQLPSVGPGNVFRDIIRSNAVKVIELSEIFRQSENSRIITCAHEINNGIKPDLKLNSDGFYFMRRKDAANAAQTIVQLFSKRLPQNMNIPPEDIQVLSPSRKGEAGTENLNRLLQAALNPAEVHKKEFTYGENVFREGDRIMQTKNDYDVEWIYNGKEHGSGIFNGDIGVITHINPASEIFSVNFDGREADFSFEQISEMEHAWAITVHKSQGCEYPAVIFAASRTAPQLMIRGVLYTAVSRAQKILIGVGEEEVIETMTHNYRRAKRYCGLKWRMYHE